jgi:multidrug efflux pump subunit AcrA (membrane-fusion protein)
MPKNVNEQVFEGERQMAIVLDSVESIPSNEANPGKLLGEMLKSDGAVPPALGELLDRVGSKSDFVLDAIAEGVRHYEEMHGRKPDPSLMAAAVQQANSSCFDFRTDGSHVVLDSASSSASDTQSLQANRAVVSILNLFESGIPFAAYLPTDISSNEAKLAILTHTAKSALGGYAADEMINGSRIGRAYSNSARSLLFPTTITAPVTQKCTARNHSTGTAGDLFGLYCDQALSGVPINRGQTIITINGLVAAEEGRNPTGVTSPLNGTIKLGAVEYSISAVVTPDTGEVTINAITPALPAGTEVMAEVCINYTKAPALAPEIGVSVQVWSLFANAERILTSTDIDAQTQIARELNIDAASQQLRAARAQQSMERYYRALRMAYAVSANTMLTHEFDMAGRSNQLVRAQIWSDFGPSLSQASQQIAEKTMDYGAEFAYVDRRVTAELQGLPSTMFESSGQRPSAGIWRVGRLLNQVDVYSIPDGTGILPGNPSAGAHEMLLIGRGSDTGRAPVILGDAVPTMLLDLATNKDFSANRGMYARNFTKRNPHQPSALGCARINITGLV